MNPTVEQRVEHARDLHRSGYNCCQAVVAAYADIFGVDENTALRMSASFGGGIGGMRQTCGAACGMFMLCGMLCGQTKAGDIAAKKYNYQQVQLLARRFKDIHGSVICAELLGLKQPEDTNATILKQPCNQTVANAARIIGEYISDYENKNS